MSMLGNVNPKNEEALDRSQEENAELYRKSAESKHSKFGKTCSSYLVASCPLSVFSSIWSMITRHSEVSPPASKKKEDDLFKVVILLMDFKTRRFELLQIELNSAKALVSDVLAMIPVSVSEEVLRRQTYTGICGTDGEPIPPSKLVSTFCKGNGVFTAIPWSFCFGMCSLGQASSW